MDLKQFYRKIAEAEAQISEQYPVLSSLETPDGGKAGIVTEVPRHVAAKMIVEGRAVLASEAEKRAFVNQQATAKKAAERAELSRRVQVIIGDSDLDIPASDADDHAESNRD
jgi:hypothetical protein